MVKSGKSIGHPKVLKSANKASVLNAVRDFGPVSRKTVCSHTNLGWGSIGKYVDQLLADGMLLETRIAESTGGRRSIMLEVNPEYGCFIGATVGSYTTRVALIDFKGAVKFSAEHRTNSEASKEEVLSLLIKRIRSAHAEFAEYPIKGVGIGVSGEVDSDSGRILAACNFRDFDDVELGDALRTSFDTEVFVMNKLTAVTLGEMAFGEGLTCDDFICVALGGGIGSGIVSMGNFVWPHPLRGIGDIGHMTLDKNGPVCGCGLRGCLDAFAGGKALERIVAGKRGDMKIEDISPETVAANDELSKIAVSAGERIGEGVAAMIQAYHPEKVALSGRLLNFGPILIDSIKQKVRSKIHEERFDPEQLVASKLNGTAGPLGAAQYVWDRLYTGKREF